MPMVAIKQLFFALVATNPQIPIRLKLQQFLLNAKNESLKNSIITVTIYFFYMDFLVSFKRVFFYYPHTYPNVSCTW